MALTMQAGVRFCPDDHVAMEQDGPMDDDFTCPVCGLVYCQSAGEYMNRYDVVPLSEK